MSYINLSSATKLARAMTINAAIGSSGNMLLFTGAPPNSPDYPVTGSLLATLPLSSPAGIASYAVISAAIITPGTGGTNGAQLVSGTTGTGIKFQASVTITGGAITAILAIVIIGAYSVAPTALRSEPITGAGLTGAVFSLVLTAQLLFGAISAANAIATGTVGYARIQTAAGLGVIDLDCGLSAASVIINTTAIVLNSPVLCTTDLLVES